MIDKKILSYFWRYIKPYKWHYAVMLAAPILSSFNGFIYNYAIKFGVAPIKPDNLVSHYLLQILPW